MHRTNFSPPTVGRMAKRIFTRDLLDRIVPDNVKTHFGGLEALVWTELNVQQDNMILRKDKDGRQRVRQSGGPMNPKFGRQFLLQIINSCRGVVSTEYIEHVLPASILKAVERSLIVNGNNHEMVVITAKRDPNLGEISQQNILAGDVLGFMILYTGECKMHNDVPALQIICSNGSDKRVANYLLYLYVKCLREHNVKKGLLEVAGGYANPGAMCLYNKFGFREDALLDTSECFPESANGTTLAMSADLEDPGYDDIDQMVVNNDAIQLKRGVEGELMCAKTSDIGQKGVLQDEYINMRVENRNYLNRLFREESRDWYQEEIDQLMVMHDVNSDLLEGDEYDMNYVKRELLEKGKKIVEVEKKTLQEYSGNHDPMGSVSSVDYLGFRSSVDSASSDSSDSSVFSSSKSKSPGTKKRGVGFGPKSKYKYKYKYKSPNTKKRRVGSKYKSPNTKKRRVGSKSKSPNTKKRRVGSKSKYKSPNTKKRRFWSRYNSNPRSVKNRRSRS